MRKIALLCIGDELLKGSTVNTNLAFIGSMLLKHGITLEYSLEIPDDENAIRSALADVLERADIVLTSGGLGPTADDMTKEAVARHFHLPLEQNGPAVLSIRRFWKMRHPDTEPSGRVLNQSLVPAGAVVIPNRNGTAPGIVLRPADGKMVILLPGPPGEICPMFEEDVMPLLLKEDLPREQTVLLHICGIGESEVEERMLPLLSTTHPLGAAYCAGHGAVKLFLRSGSDEVLADAIAYAKKEFGKAVLQTDNVAADVVALLKKRGMTLVTAESCTGGLVAKMITDVAGASDVYPGSVVSYANEVKEQLLGVKHETLVSYGAVSRETAREMAEGAAARFGSDCAIALTGIAGPGGGTPEKPVGLVYCGIFCGGRCEIFEFRLKRSREQIRERAAAGALNRLRLMLLELEENNG